MKRLIALLLLAACPWLANAANIEQLIQLTDYVGVDYAGAVEHGVIINPGEYGEMQDFSSAIVEQVAELPPTDTSRQLAGHFGESLEQESCGHCSFCKSGKAILKNTSALKPLSRFNFDEVSGEFIRVVGERFSEVNLTKFLCGIYTPVFSKLKIKKLPYFGILEKHPFLEDSG